MIRNNALNLMVKTTFKIDGIKLFWRKISASITTMIDTKKIYTYHIIKTKLLLYLL